MAEDAFGAIVAALARGDRTSFELEQRLLQTGFDPAACADALVRASEAGYLDDARVAGERARRLADRGSSDAGIRAKLVKMDYAAFAQTVSQGKQDQMGWLTAANLPDVPALLG